jgi:adenylate cyclase
MREVGDLALWLAENAALPIADLHDSFCRRLDAEGLPLWRAVLGTETLHPEQLGGQLVWLSEAEPTETVYYHGVERTSSYLSSPLRVVDETGRAYRRRLDGDVSDMPLLEELKESGATDYMIVPLAFLDRTRSASISFATKRQRGFADAELERLELATLLASPYVERHVLRRIAVGLLDTYVGRHAGERIFSGQVRRGAVDTINAAILMSDMRGFTALSSRSGLEAVVETLDAWFEAIAAPIETHQGEILKFMGDGLLAIFPAAADSADACRRAAAAAEEALAAVAVLNAKRAGDGAEPIEFVLGLHVGEVAYGNIGGRLRLDFTVLGPAVNYANRLQELAKSLGQTILISEDFAKRIEAPLVDLGCHPMRGIGAAEKVFALSPAA